MTRNNKVIGISKTEGTKTEKGKHVIERMTNELERDKNERCRDKMSNGGMKVSVRNDDDDIHNF